MSCKFKNDTVAVLKVPINDIIVYFLITHYASCDVINGKKQKKI